MTSGEIAFAVPGKITNLTGGTIYDRRVIDALPALGIKVRHIELPGSFPNPPAADMRRTLDLLSSVPADIPLVVDGLAFGALDTGEVAKLRAPLFPLVHHPLAEETGISEVDRQRLFETERDNLGHARHVLVPSPHTAGLLTAKYDVPQAAISIARPGTDRPTLTAAPATPPLILAVGIQLPRKGHDVLLKALSHIDDLEWSAVIAGAPLDPGYAEELRTLNRRLGLEARVTLAGQIERSALEGLYAKASVFALATRYEGYGIVFDEALAHGLPIVSCATGAVPDTVPQDAGLLTAPDTPEDFARALRRMLTEPDLRRASAAAARAAGLSLPSWTDTAAQVAAVLRRHQVVPPNEPANATGSCRNDP
ncbi:glycosyltransferase family 4 protein [Marivita hallyeonensis]|uniref:Glycosyltransferase involved in cell wall bisynthesis n=1 Tax=Marivita hallyeonensis TaxID=996342 RepID=A0A1M5S7U3_9RHOB|nr:glycosyltransferase family 4 protein [Marivita hallyeonensis]SHH34525.1 Glycosyltransferase involved in cell wall bisynthesis [Marivita hallyeonensis]